MIPFITYDNYKFFEGILNDVSINNFASSNLDYLINYSH